MYVCSVIQGLCNVRCDPCMSFRSRRQRGMRHWGLFVTMMSSTLALPAIRFPTGDPRINCYQVC